jgi:phage gp46-like protein
MTKKVDLKLRRRKDLKDLYDLELQNGDLALVNNFNTALQMVIYCERRADPSEVRPPQLRRGWWGNELSLVAGFEIGSKLWLLKQARRTQDTLNKAITYTQEGLQWLVDDGYLDKVEVEGFFSGDSGIRLEIRLLRPDNITETRFFDLWQNTERTIDDDRVL